MKIIKSSNKLETISATKQLSTVFYETTIENAIDALERSNGNIWVIELLKSNGWDAIDFKHNLFGSKVIDDKLYICETNGQDIQVNGQPVDPERALEECSIEDLSEYIQPASDDKITSSITGYEITVSNVEDVAIQLLEDGNSFSDVVRDAEELELIN